ncbi:hypothetical protein Q8A67_019412 [Cirrhinus molitorella]|uniref:Ig-like domain-containing protein n=1 Tax=Cirrhinus molitorella TaxID=172907 RepID=A0AA88TGD1_9TELE|nr:hypothetical protein Q8A67_019412 [Cirrhinus molitorella]
MKALIIFTVTLISFSDFSHSNKVDQSPPDVILKPEESAKIQCSHRITSCLICEKVHQSPSDVLCKPSDSVNLTCRHNIASYDTILWYQRSYGDSSLKLIGYARYSSMKEFEPSYKVPAVCKDVQQSPDAALCHPNSIVKLTCSHNIKTYDTILWYQRSPGDMELKLLAYMYYKTPTTEGPYVDHFNISGFSVNSTVIQTPTDLLSENNAESCCIGLSVALNVIQTPTNLFLATGATMNITCSHHDKTYDKIFWYQQSDGQNLEHIGVLSFKQPLVDRKGFTVAGDAEKEAFLVVPSVKAEHSGVYFCAVSAALCYKFIEACV